MDLHAFFASEVKPTIGCTEPGAVAFAAAVAAKHFSGPVEKIHLAMSQAIFKNGRSVGIPGANGLRGLPLAAALGALGGNADKGLMSLEGVAPDIVERAQALLAADKVELEVNPDAPPMWTTVTLVNADHTVSCTVAGRHDHVEKLVADGVVKIDTPLTPQTGIVWMDELMGMSFQDLWDLAHGIDADIERQMLEGARMNMDILLHDDGSLAGLGIGSTLAKHAVAKTLPGHIKEVAGAASDLRMSGGEVTVMSSAGSGNHGIVAIIPVAMTARDLGRSDHDLAVALALSHLVCGYIKAYTGRLTPTCGCAVAAGAGAASGIVHLHGGNVEQAEHAAITLVGTLLGMICDGAKESCGLKVSSAASEAWVSAMLALENKGIQQQQGIISPDIRQLGATLREFNEKIFAAADSVMIGLMTRRDQTPDAKAAPGK